MSPACYTLSLERFYQLLRIEAAAVELLTVLSEFGSKDPGGHLNVVVSSPTMCGLFAGSVAELTRAVVGNPEP